MGGTEAGIVGSAGSGRSGLVRLLSLLRLDVAYTRACGDRLFYRDAGGQEHPVLDFLGGYGSTILGHSHPIPKEALQRALEADVPVHAQASIRPWAARVGEKLNALLRAESPGGESRYYHVHLLNTGTEATEAAIKHALLEWRGRQSGILLRLEGQRQREVHAERSSKREIGLAKLTEAVRSAEPVLLALEGAFHGKTAGALAATFNDAYSGMYHSRAVRVEFLAPNAASGTVGAAFDRHRVTLSREASFSNVIGVLAEPIQGEGGVRPLTAEFLADLAQRGQADNVPLIADEIQTGIYRTGRLLASHGLGVDPDYVMLGKSLGGGYAKVAALLVREDHYQPEFGIVHTSTFAEDDLSSLVALSTLDHLSRMPTFLAERAAWFEARIKDGFGHMMKRHPGVFREIRGRGFMLGVEFLPDADGKSVLVLDALSGTGYLPYVYASYLLHRHGIRVAATLNSANTLRLEPSALIEDASVDACLAAFEQLAQLVSERRFVALTAHLWPEASADAALARSRTVSPLSPSRIYRRTGLRKAAFLSHFIDDDHLKGFDRLFEVLSPADRRHFLDEIGPLAKPVIYHEQIMVGAGGAHVQFQLHGLTVPSRFFERCLREGNPSALRKVQEGVNRAFAIEGLSHVGLGQYTSIVTDSGTLLSLRPEWNVTTGNSLTVGFAYEALEDVLARKGWKLRDLHVGIVGIAGNICNTYAQLVADHARELTLVHREAIEVSPRFQRAVRSVLENSTIEPARVHSSSSMKDLSGCDVVILGTNSSQPLLRPEHLARDAVVLDISVPSNVDPAVYETRPDVECLQGGYARLPLGQQCESRLVPAPDGQIFACMAETVTLALANYRGCFSYGPLSKSGVLEIVEMAKRAGITIGSLKRTASF